MRSFLPLALAAVALLGAGAAQSAETEAVAVMRATAGHGASGTVRFRVVDGRMRIVADMRGLRPEGKHGFHIHQFGDLRAEDGKSAGGHYNPQGHPHSLPGGGPAHAGDLGNLVADADGHAHLELEVDHLSLDGERNPVLGRAVVVHAEPDDGGQPTGNAGARIAVGVVGWANPEFD